ncbi:MAG: hypothetical protein QF595_10715 [Dehalococcoidia bacterium]|nr:hypothetical protein [Dehalococcoidia bacterium]
MAYSLAKKHVLNFMSLRTILLIALFFLFAVLITFPLIISPNSWLVYSDGGNDIRVSDQAIHVSILADMQKSMYHGKSIWKVLFFNPDYYVSPSYAILGGTLSFIFPFLISHNLLLFLFNFLSFLMMYLLAKKITENTIASIYAAIVFGASNFLIHHILDGHGHVTQIYLIPLLFLLIEKMLNNLSLKNAVMLGVFSGIMVLSCIQYVLYASLFVPVYVLARKPKIIINRDFLGLILISVAIA